MKKSKLTALAYLEIIFKKVESEITDNNNFPTDISVL